MRALALIPLLALTLSGCEAPAGAAIVKCTGEFTIGRPERTCSVNVAQLKDSAGATFKGEKRHRHAAVNADFTVKQGTVQVVVRGNGAAKEYTLTPEAPLHIEEDVRLHLNKRSFYVGFKGDAATAIEGTVRYKVR